MKPHQLKLLIKEVLREIESEVEDPKTNSGIDADAEDSIPPHELRKKQFGTSAPVLSLSLSGINKNNTQTLKDFIGIVAHEAGKLQLSIIHAELEKAGKVGLELDGSEIKKSEAEINAELDAIAANDQPELDPNTGMPTRASWKKMSPEQRDKYVKKGSHAAEWEKATQQDVEDTRKKTALKAAKIKAGTYDPEDTSLWTDKEWDAWNAKQDQAATYDTGKSAGKYKPNLSKNTAQGVKGAIKGNFSDTLRHE